MYTNETLYSPETYLLISIITAAIWFGIRALMLSNERNKEEEKEQNKL